MNLEPPVALDPVVASRLKRDQHGLVAAIVQQHDTGEVLMLGWMDDEALHRTLTTGRATYWSRSRRRYWVKGETSGNIQRVTSVALDCDGDALLVRVDQVGGACHTGDRTCFDAGALVAPVADAPVADAPVADAPVADAPVADAPVADAPVADAPVADAPVADAPAPASTPVAS